MTRSFASARALDVLLGPSTDPTSVCSAARTVSLDEVSAFPTEAVEALTQWDVHKEYVPENVGGNMNDPVATMLQMRHVARRDLTVAVAHGKTFLGGICAWIAGEGTANEMASLIMAGHPVSWGLTEQGRGSDLVRSTTAADRAGSNFVLSGSKWPINNATRGRAMCVLARTKPEAGPRSLSLLLVDKAEASRQAYRYLPKVRTHGIRGADISGIEWDRLTVSSERVMGEVGQGLELVLKGLQITRPVCTALSLGAADTAISAVQEVVFDRRLYGRRLTDLPAAVSAIGVMIADALIAEATALVAGRHISGFPEEMALISALAKLVVPATVEMVMQNATQILGARSQLVAYTGSGLFEKAARDHRIVGIFDGNSVVNLRTIISEFPAIAKPGHPAADLNRLCSVLDPMPFT